MDTKTAQKNWEIENNIVTVDPEKDAIYCYDEALVKAELAGKPWQKDPHHYKHVRVSSIALIKMVMHARSGGDIEVMGLMQGKVQGDTMYVMDAFALPVEGTETRVNAQNEAYEYMVTYMESAREAGRLENAIGWYHSHPGYGCWLSGIDVATQKLHQTHEEPFVAVVIDPSRTMSAGKVEIGAFRTYPEGYRPPNDGSFEYQSIPLNKIDDYGVHAKSYYPLEVSHFKSTLDDQLLDVLWNKYWVNTLSQSPLLTNREYTTMQMIDVASKLGLQASDLKHIQDKKEDRGGLSRTSKDSSKITGEAIRGLISQVLKDHVFNQPR